MQTDVLTTLLKATWQSPVFGDSFPGNASSEVVASMVGGLMRGFSADLYDFIRPALVDLSDEQVHAIVAQIAPKTVSFCPALTAGELDDAERLQAVAVAIGLMYWADQTMDRGDATMGQAIRIFGGQNVALHEAQQKRAMLQVTALRGIATKIASFALPEDAPFVLDCFDRQVLLNEVNLDQLSSQYQDAADKAAFLTTHAAKVAHYMVEDAGFPSVASSLYAIYRQHNAKLPPLQEIYATPELMTLLQVCNAVVRVADELGDWETDAGLHPEWGGFCLNLFNQADPALLQAFFAKAYLPHRLQASTQKAFMHFKDNPAVRAESGEKIMTIFFAHVKQAIRDMPLSLQSRYALYITLCKRVLEIGYVNRIGDIALATNV